MSTFRSRLLNILDIDIPLILAPMYLVTNEEMIIEACNSGATGAIPAMNWPKPELMRLGIRKIKSQTSKPFGINIISHPSNPSLDEQVQVCIDEKIGFVITSLGNPEMVIKKCKPRGIKVFCDVVDSRHAKRLEEFGADGLIAVNNQAGGHAGTLPPHTLITELKKQVSIPVIAAGGVATHEKFKEMLELGAEGASVGTLFIATPECHVSDEYKQAVIQYSEEDIIMTDRLSGTPCAVINTPYVQKIGTKQNFIERLLNKNKRLKRYLKQYAYARGMKMLKKAAFSATYQTVWVAGPSIKHVSGIVGVKQRIAELTEPLTFKKDS